MGEEACLWGRRLVCGRGKREALADRLLPFLLSEDVLKDPNIKL